MSRPHALRFTLGQLIAVVAAAAVLLTAATFGIKGQRIYLLSIQYCIHLAFIIILLINVRISEWMWLLVASYACRAVWGIALNLMPPMRASYFNMVTTTYSTLDSVFSLLFVVGLAMVFRDVRLSPTDREHAPPST
jgi:hypothetical protein